MFRDMRRSRQLLTDAETKAILEKCTSGVLALSGDDGYPYAVPLSYVYSGDRLYFHCAKEGHKLDAIEHCDKASFCVIERDDILPEKYTTAYKSVIVFGRVRVLKTVEEMEEPIKILTKKYVGNDDDGIKKEFDTSKNHMYMICFDIEHTTGKQAKELI